MGRLRAQPIAVGKTEKPAQAQIGVGRDGPPAGHDLADALGRDANFLGQAEGVVYEGSTPSGSEEFPGDTPGSANTLHPGLFMFDP